MNDWRGDALRRSRGPGAVAGSSGTAVVNAGNLHYTATAARSYTFTFNDNNRTCSIQ